MKKLPIGLQDFARLRQENYLYVDKTEQLYELATSGVYYFLSRPRPLGLQYRVSTGKVLLLTRAGVNYRRARVIGLTP